MDSLEIVTGDCTGRVQEGLSLTTELTSIPAIQVNSTRSRSRLKGKKRPKIRSYYEFLVDLHDSKVPTQTS